MSNFARELEQSISEALAYLDGKLAARVSYYVTPREVREDVGLTPAELAERLGMDIDAYLDWETHRVVLRDEAAFRLRESERPARLLSLFVEVSRRST